MNNKGTFSYVECASDLFPESEPKIMSPLELSILIHYRGCVNDFRDGDFSAPAVHEAIDRFKDVGMLEPTSGSYKLTDKGKYFVDYLCRIPLPVQKWEIPE